MDVVGYGDVHDGEAGRIEGRLRDCDGRFDLEHQRLKFGHRLSVTDDVGALFERDEKGFACVNEIVVGILYFGGWVEVLCAVDEVARSRTGSASLPLLPTTVCRRAPVDCCSGSTVDCSGSSLTCSWPTGDLGATSLCRPAPIAAPTSQPVSPIVDELVNEHRNTA